MRIVSRALAAVLLLGALLAACGPPPPPPPAPPKASYDPSGPCQRGLGHVIDLAVAATGAGPTDAQRSEYLRRCVAQATGRGIECVLSLRRLPGRRSGPVQMGPVWACLARR